MAGKKLSKWTDSEIEYLKNNYSNMTYKEIAKNLNKTNDSVSYYIEELGLKKPPKIYPKIGDIINGWKIVDIIRENNKRNNTFGILEDIETGSIRKVRLTEIKNIKPNRKDYYTENGVSRKHGLHKTAIYTVWSTIKSRCYYKNNHAYERYGGRGIKMCDEWKNDAELFCSWAIENGWKEGLTIDRIDNEKGYSPDNCRIVTTAEQARNRRDNIFITAFGETKIAKDWSTDKRCNCTYPTLISRIKQGMDPELAITQKRRKPLYTNSL